MRPRAVQSCELIADLHGQMVPHIHCRQCESLLPWNGDYFFSRGYKHDPEYLNNLCKSCSKQASSTWGKENPEQMRVYHRRSALKHPETGQRSSERRRERYQTDVEFRQTVLAKNRTLRRANLDRYRSYKAKERASPFYREKVNRRKRRRYDEDPNFKIAFLVRERLRVELKRNGLPKARHSIEYAQCPVAFLRWWIESQFMPGMTWENWGNGVGKWHLDHVYPCCYFDLTKQDQLLICFSWMNLRPLWSQDNLSKGGQVPAADYEI